MTIEDRRGSMEDRDAQAPTEALSAGEASGAAFVAFLAATEKLSPIAGQSFSSFGVWPPERLNISGRFRPST